MKNHLQHKTGDRLLARIENEALSLTYVDSRKAGANESHAFMRKEMLGAFEIYRLIFCDKKHISYEPDGTMILDLKHTGQRFIRKGTPDYERLRTIDEAFF